MFIRRLATALLVAVSACAGHPAEPAQVPRERPGPGASRAPDAVVQALEELLNRPVPTEHQPGTPARQALAALRGRTSVAGGIEAGTVDRLDALLTARDALPRPSDGPSYDAYFTAFDRLRDEMAPLFTHLVELYPDDPHLAARVALFLYLRAHPANARLTSGNGVIRGLQSPGDDSPRAASSEEERSHALGLSRMEDASRRFADDPEVRWLAGNLCTLSHREAGSSVAPCLDHFVRCRAVERCSVAYEAGKREVAHAHCDGAAATGLAVYQAELLPADTGKAAPSSVQLAGARYALKGQPFFTDGDVEQLYEASFQTNFSVSITDAGSPELDPVVRVRLRPERRSAVATAYNAAWQASMAARGADGAYVVPPLVVMRGSVPVGVMALSSPWRSATDFTFWNMKIGDVCSRVTSL